MRKPWGQWEGPVALLTRPCAFLTCEPPMHQHTLEFSPEVCIALPVYLLFGTLTV